MKLAELQRAHIKDLLTTKRDGKLSKNTVRLIRPVLSVLLADAVDDGVVPTNQAQGPGVAASAQMPSAQRSAGRTSGL